MGILAKIAHLAIDIFKIYQECVGDQVPPSLTGSLATVSSGVTDTDLVDINSVPKLSVTASCRPSCKMLPETHPNPGDRVSSEDVCEPPWSVRVLAIMAQATCTPAWL